MTKTVDGISDAAWDALCKKYRSKAAVFEASIPFAGKRTHGLRLLAKHHGINPDA